MREKTGVIGKLPKRIQLRTDMGGHFVDFTEGKLYHPMFALFVAPSEDDPKELLFVVPDDRGVIRTLPAWFFTTAK